MLDHHGDLVGTALACADEVGKSVPTPAGRQVVTTRLKRALREAGAFPEFVGVVWTAADALDTELPAEPVAAPPYVVVTARGPMVRATVEPGRVVVLVRCFERADEGYVRGEATGADAVEVTVHEA